MPENRTEASEGEGKFKASKDRCPNGFALPRHRKRLRSLRSHAHADVTHTRMSCARVGRARGEQKGAMHRD